MQAVFGTRSENLKTDVEEYLRGGAAQAGPPTLAARPSPPPLEPSREARPAITPEHRALAGALIAALGGPETITAAELCALTRVRIELREPRALNEAGLEAAGAAGVLRVSDSVVHLVLGERAPAVAAALDDELRAPVTL
jgi:PTS system glucose-specific IIC component